MCALKSLKSRSLILNKSKCAFFSEALAETCGDVNYKTRLPLHIKLQDPLSLICISQSAFERARCDISLRSPFSPYPSDRWLPSKIIRNGARRLTYKGLEMSFLETGERSEMLRRAMQYLRREYYGECVAAFLCNKYASASCGNCNTITCCKKKTTNEGRSCRMTRSLIVRSRSPLISSRLPLR